MSLNYNIFSSQSPSYRYKLSTKSPKVKENIAGPKHLFCYRKKFYNEALQENLLTMSPNFDNEEKEGTDDSELLPKRGTPKKTPEIFIKQSEINPTVIEKEESRSLSGIIPVVVGKEINIVDLLPKSPLPNSEKLQKEVEEMSRINLAGKAL